MVHNFEEIIMIPIWWRRNQHAPVRSPFTALAKYPPGTVAALIAIIFTLFSVVTAASIISHHLLVGIGLALAFGLQLVGHMVEFLRLRRYMPHIVTAAATFPYYPWLLFKAMHSGYTPADLLLATLGMGVFGLLVLLTSHALSSQVSRWLASH